MRILVTGGAGAFGSEFVRTALTWPDIERLVVFNRDEHKQERLLRALGPDPEDRLRFFLGDVRDRDRLVMAMSGITHVVHAAALKIVPWGEYNAHEFAKTNVSGAGYVADAAILTDVRHVVSLSTDKAVSPVNLYGATKLVGEKLFLAANALSGGRCMFTVVRYGNVTGSTGSVLPLWRETAARDESLPITDKRMTRFWMTLPQAVEVVREALLTSEGGEVRIPKLPSYNVRDLAEAVWAEKQPDSEWACRMKDIGIRPGEKLHESLVSEDEAPWTYDRGTHYEIVQVPGLGGPGGRVEQALGLSGSRVPEGFRYRSDENDEWLTTNDLKKRLRAIP